MGRASARGSRAAAVQGCAVRRDARPRIRCPRTRCSATPRRRRKSRRQVERLVRRSRRLHVFGPCRTGRAASAASRSPPRASSPKTSNGRLSGRVDGDIVYATSEFLSRAGQAQPALQRDLGRELHRLRRVGLVGLPRGRAADHLGRGRRAVLCRCGLGARHARVPAAEFRHHPHSAMGGAGRILSPATRTSSSSGSRSRPSIGSASPAPISTRRRCHRRRPPPSPRCSWIRSAPTATSAIRTTASAPIRSSRAGTSRRSTTAAPAAQPTFYRLPTGTPEQPFVFQPRYDRIWQAGGTVSKDLGEMVLRAEAVYANGQGYSVTSLSVPQGVVKRIDARLHRERRVSAARRHASQRPGFPARLFQRRRRATSWSRATDSARASSSRPNSTAAFEPQILWIQNFKDAGGLSGRGSTGIRRKTPRSGSASISSPGQTTVISAATTTATASTRNFDTTSSEVSVARPRRCRRDPTSSAVRSAVG